MLHIKWASFLQKAGQHEKAASHYGQSLALFPSTRAHFGRGTCLAALRRRQEAIADLEEAQRMSPDMVGVRINLAGVLIAVRRFEEALGHCEAALRLEPKSREAVMNMANALRNLGRREDAMELVWSHIQRDEAAAASAIASAATTTEDAAGAAPAAVSECATKLEAATSAPPASTSSTGAEGTAAPVPSPAPLRCNDWASAAGAGCDDLPLVVACLKWGTRYDAAYVNRLHAGVRRHLPVPFRFLCFTEDAQGLDDGVEARPLPFGLPLWWGKAHLFSEEAGLDGCRVLFLDLDQIIVGSLASLVAYRGPFALLATDGIACELAHGGYNSSVISWEGSACWRPLRTRLTAAALRYVHRFDHWLEMNLEGADLWQRLEPGLVVDYTAEFRGGVCLGQRDEEEDGVAGSFAGGPADEASAQDAAARREEPLPGTAIVTFPRNPKPHDVLQQHAWVRRHWLQEGEGEGEEALAAAEGASA